MFDFFIDWFGGSGIVPDDIYSLFAFCASLLILHFILDFFRFVIYYISRR